jgi:hypothetical protein
MKRAELEFVNFLRSRGIDYQPWRADTTNLYDVPATGPLGYIVQRLAESNPWNRFPGS